MLSRQWKTQIMSRFTFLNLLLIVLLTYVVIQTVVTPVIKESQHCVVLGIRLFGAPYQTACSIQLVTCIMCLYEHADTEGHTSSRQQNKNFHKTFQKKSLTYAYNLSYLD